MLTDAERAEVEAKLAATEAIRNTYRGRTYTSQTCPLCNWASNGLTLDEAIAANSAHLRQHPEYEEFVAANIPLRLLVRSLHDHTCDMLPCRCRCGCQAVYCHIVGGDLCSTCAIAANRGDDEHGMSQDGMTWVISVRLPPGGETADRETRISQEGVNL